MSDRVLFELGGLSISSIEGNAGFSQQYEVIGGFTTLRMKSGAAKKQSHWTKLRTIIQCSGWIPDGLVNIDYSQELTLKCGVARAVTGSSNVINVPSARRSDSGYTPIGEALNNGVWESRSISWATDEATVSTSAGDTRYRVKYWPELTVVCDPPQEDYNEVEQIFTWSLVAEEV